MRKFLRLWREESLIWVARQTDFLEVVNLQLRKSSRNFCRVSLACLSLLVPGRIFVVFLFVVLVGPLPLMSPGRKNEISFSQ